MIRRPGIVHRSEVGDVGTPAIGEFMEIQLAEKDTSRIFQSSRDFGIGVRNSVLEEFAGAGRANPSGIDVVLQRDGDSVQGAAPSAAGYFRLRLARGSKRLLSRYRD